MINDIWNEKVPATNTDQIMFKFAEGSPCTHPDRADTGACFTAEKDSSHSFGMTDGVFFCTRLYGLPGNRNEGTHVKRIK